MSDGSGNPAEIVQEIVPADGAETNEIAQDIVTDATRIADVQQHLDRVQGELVEAQDKLAGVTAERDALAKAASAAAKAPRSTEVPTVKARKCRALDDAFGAEDLLALIGDAETVELVFSDGTSEIPTLPARVIEGDAWVVTFAGLALRLPELLIEGPGPGVLLLAGYGLFLDGKQIAWAARPEVLSIPPGARMNLQGDVLFGAG